MFELTSTFWYVLWSVMGLAFLCAWIFIVVGCHRIDSHSQSKD
jgi:hypothetical protein